MYPRIIFLLQQFYLLKQEGYSYTFSDARNGLIVADDRDIITSIVVNTFLCDEYSRILYT